MTLSERFKQAELARKELASKQQATFVHREQQQQQPKVRQNHNSSTDGHSQINAQSRLGPRSSSSLPNKKPHNNNNNNTNRNNNSNKTAVKNSKRKNEQQNNSNKSKKVSDILNRLGPGPVESRLGPVPKPIEDRLAHKVGEKKSMNNMNSNNHGDHVQRKKKFVKGYHHLGSQPYRKPNKSSATQNKAKRSETVISQSGQHQNKNSNLDDIVIIQYKKSSGQETVNDGGDVTMVDDVPAIF